MAKYTVSTKIRMMRWYYDIMARYDDMTWYDDMIQYDNENSDNDNVMIIMW